MENHNANGEKLNAIDLSRRLEATVHLVIRDQDQKVTDRNPTYSFYNMGVQLTSL
jgi:hypothetical protein